ncbi:MAG: SGNH/GDSL hydrolase family protein [Clostridia bacterium]|nr:SGNH/GDSL hydrolase family protein [Clostridia bacterium]
MDLKNKTILFLGSSVTYGSAAQGRSFVDIMKDAYGATCIKEAVSGTTLVDLDEQSYVSRLKAIDKDIKVDLFICQLSTNDAARDLELDDIQDAICCILDYVENTFGCPIIFYTGTYFKSEKYASMIELLYGLKEEYSFHILDLYHDEDMQNVSKEDYDRYMNDPIHPTFLGYKEWWTPKFVDFCHQILSGTPIPAKTD